MDPVAYSVGQRCFVEACDDLTLVLLGVHSFIQYLTS
jgi:hypothetical protein